MAHITTGGLEPLVLASASPRRRELLARVGIPIEVVAADTDESPIRGESAVACARRLAADKAAAVAQARPHRWVLAADTVVEIDGDILGKAADGAEATAMLVRLVGREHRVITAYAVRGPGAVELVEHVTSTVLMRTASDREVADYVAAGEWRGKAGAYAVQGMAAAMVREVHGSITNVIGLPLAEVVETLERLGAARLSYVAGASS
ncbi:MAG TPA: Maf family protein [Kofleriaceae bacterium]|nr:Maf family protein [Kofleriaceae bacterium]